VLQQFVEKYNVPVEFFGKVIDQDSNALAGVNVKLSVIFAHHKRSHANAHKDQGDKLRDCIFNGYKINVANGG
jgi:hypothetical protein